MDNFIEVTDLQYSNSDFKLGPINCTFGAGEFIVVVGSNGAGKTTFFSLLIGLLIPEDGSLLVMGLKDSWKYRKQFTICLDDSCFNPQVSGLANLQSSAIRRGLQMQNAEDFIKGFHMEKALSKLYGSYSFGMKKKLGLIAALMADTPLYLFDEPTSGLDLEATKFFFTKIEELLAKGKTVMLSTHLTSGFEPKPTKVCLLKAGLAEWVSPEEEVYSQSWFSALLVKHYELV
ncbi:MAG: ABC transporter ATP-binding protein [Bacteroidota bacterium]